MYVSGKRFLFPLLQVKHYAQAPLAALAYLRLHIPSQREKERGRRTLYTLIKN